VSGSCVAENTAFSTSDPVLIARSATSTAYRCLTVHSELPRFPEARFWGEACCGHNGTMRLVWFNSRVLDFLHVRFSGGWR
jgi:hypothetical protein